MGRLEDHLTDTAVKTLRPHVEGLETLALGIKRCIEADTPNTVATTMGSIQGALHDLHHNVTDEEPVHKGRLKTCELLGLIAAEAILALRAIEDGEIARAMDQVGRKVWR